MNVCEVRILVALWKLTMNEQNKMRWDEQRTKKPDQEIKWTQIFRHVLCFIHSFRSFSVGYVLNKIRKTVDEYHTKSLLLADSILFGESDSAFFHIVQLPWHALTKTNNKNFYSCCVFFSLSNSLLFFIIIDPWCCSVVLAHFSSIPWPASQFVV